MKFKVVRFLSKRGYIIMAVSDSRGGVYARKGLNIEKLIVHKKQTRTVVEFLQATKKITNQQIWEQLVDMVAPAALEN